MKDEGLTLPELLIGVLVLGLLGLLGSFSAAEILARQRVEHAARRLSQGIEQARSQALLQERGCVLHLTPSGWIAAPSGELPPCIAGREPMQEAGLGAGGLQVLHNLPPELRFTSDGLVLDGGTVVLSSQGTSLRRCLVMALPLGVVRVGRYRGALQGPPDSAACLPDESL